MVRDSNSCCWGVEVEFVGSPRQVFSARPDSLDECAVDRQLCRIWRKLPFPPLFHLLPHRLEITLHAINAN
jgi:hypothetical protein